MFRVPINPDRPTFDETFKVGFFRWLTSKKRDRKEWARRRNAAAKTARDNQLAKQRTTRAETQQRLAELKAERKHKH